MHVIRHVCMVIFTVNDTNETCEENQLTHGDYLKILWTSAAELPGLSLSAMVGSTGLYIIRAEREVRQLFVLPGL